MSKEVMTHGVSSERKSSDENEIVGTYARQSTDKDFGLPACRVCQCAESDKTGDIALNFLGIIPPLQELCESDNQLNPNNCESISEHAKDASSTKNGTKDPTFVEFVSPDGEVFICSADIETGSCNQQASLIELGCSCKNDLALVHYACALKWFINHGSTICEICGCLAKNIRISDFKKVLNSLKDYEALIDRTVSGEPAFTSEQASMNVDPDAVAAIRRLRLREISLWFGPLTNNSLSFMSHVAVEQNQNVVAEQTAPDEHPATKWAVEGIGILLATGLLTVTLAWLIAPRVGKKTANNGLHILIGGACALTVVIFFRFVVLTRIKYGPARYWAILFVFWFLVFGIWASRSHNSNDS
uniref:RING-CH-type domain-containing protein n=1 Tax=Kalanchoe fedtschenkoi TaxID=63787 RepID=A0A7N0TX28_KALFE